MFGVWLVWVWGCVGQGFGENVCFGVLWVFVDYFILDLLKMQIMFFFQSAYNIFYKKKKKKKKNPEERTGQNI